MKNYHVRVFQNDDIQDYKVKAETQTEAIERVLNGGALIVVEELPDIVKIGTVELYKQEAADFYRDHKYIVTYGGIWQIHYSVANNSYYGHKVITFKGLTKRGRWFAMSAKECNELIGKCVLA